MATGRDCWLSARADRYPGRGFAWVRQTSAQGDPRRRCWAGRPVCRATPCSALAGSGLDFVFSSLPWWDFRSDWLWEEARGCVRWPRHRGGGGALSARGCRGEHRRPVLCRRRKAHSPLRRRLRGRSADAHGLRGERNAPLGSAPRHRRCHWDGAVSRSGNPGCKPARGKRHSPDCEQPGRGVARVHPQRSRSPLCRGGHTHHRQHRLATADIGGAGAADCRHRWPVRGCCDWGRTRR